MEPVFWNITIRIRCNNQLAGALLNANFDRFLFVRIDLITPDIIF